MAWNCLRTRQKLPPGLRANERVALRRAHDRVGKVAAIRVGKSKIRRAKKPVATAPASAKWRTRTDERNRPQSARES
jgi:hypothetical protein